MQSSSTNEIPPPYDDIDARKHKIQKLKNLIEQIDKLYKEKREETRQLKINLQFHKLQLQVIKK